MPTTKNLIGGAAGVLLIVTPFASAICPKKDIARPEDPTKPAVAMIVQALSTAINTPVVWNAITDEAYSIEPPDTELKVNSPQSSGRAPFDGGSRRRFGGLVADR